MACNLPQLVEKILDSDESVSGIITKILALSDGASSYSPQVVIRALALEAMVRKQVTAQASTPTHY